MQEIKVFPVFFNIFISALHDIDQLIKDQNGFVNKQDYLKVLSRIDSLKETLTSEDWKPFPDYIEILKKLDITNMLEALMRKIGKAFQSNQLMSILENDFKKLETFAHLLNFLERCYNKKYEVKENIGMISEVLLGYDITKTDRPVTDCIGNTIWTKPVNNAPGKPEYQKIMSLLGTYDKEALQGFSEYLFSHIQEDSASNVYDYADSSGNIFDNKPALLKFSIDEGNAYKKEHNAFMEALAAQKDEDEAENDNRTGNALI